MLLNEDSLPSSGKETTLHAKQCPAVQKQSCNNLNLFKCFQKYFLNSP